MKPPQIYFKFVTLINTMRTDPLVVIKYVHNKAKQLTGVVLVLAVVILFLEIVVSFVVNQTGVADWSLRIAQDLVNIVLNISGVQLTLIALIVIWLLYVYRPYFELFFRFVMKKETYKLLFTLGGSLVVVQVLTFLLFSDYNLSYIIIGFILSFAVSLVGITGYYCWKLIELKESKSEFFFSDETLKAKDNLNDQQNDVYLALKNILDVNSPKSISLTGEWGSGKTTIIELLKQELTDITWVDVRPWSYTNEEAFVKGFYETILSELNQSDKTIQTSLGKLRKPIQDLIGQKTYSGIAGFIMSFLSVRLNIVSPEERINQIVKRKNSHIVVVVDNVERNYHKEIINRSLQLSHYLKQIENAQSLMLFERDALIATRPESAIRPQEYLEKYFEVELKLSRPSPSELESLLKNLLEDKLGIYMTDINPALLRSLNTYRACLRLVNEIIMQNIIKRNFSFDTNSKSQAYINFEDILFLSHIKLRYPLLYDDIDNHREFYTQQKFGIEVNNKYMSFDDDSKPEKMHLDSIFTQMQLDYRTRDNLRSLLYEYFPSASQTLGGVSSTVNIDELDKDRRVGSRKILDWYFGIASDMNVRIENEKIVHDLIDNLETKKEQPYETFIDSLLTTQYYSELITLLFVELKKSGDLYSKENFSLFIGNLFRSLLRNENYSSIHRPRLILLSAIYNEIEYKQNFESPEFLENLVNSMFHPKNLKSNLINGVVALYLVEFRVNSYASRISGMLSKEVRKSLDTIALAKINSYFQHRDMVEDTESLLDFFYLMNAWHSLELRVSGSSEIKSNRYLSKMAKLHPKELLDIFDGIEYGRVTLPLYNNNNEIEVVSKYLEVIKKSSKLDEIDKIRIKELTEFIKKQSSTSKKSL